MIKLSVIGTNTPQVYRATAQGVFYFRKPIVIEHCGTPEHIRLQLQPEYRCHLMMVVEEYIFTCNPTNDALLQKETDRVKHVLKEHAENCHVAMAMELSYRLEDLRDMVPYTDDRDVLLDQFEFVKKTITTMATSKQSHSISGRTYKQQN